jgi:hypothetical protein
MECLRHLGHQRQRHFARRLAEAVKPDRGMQPVQCGLFDTVRAQLCQSPLQPHARTDRADIESLAQQRRRKTALVILTVVREHRDGRPAVDPDCTKRARRIAAMIADAGERRLDRPAGGDQHHFPPHLARQRSRR